MTQSTLQNGWTFRLASPGVGYRRANEPANPWRPAQVPGHIHDDLVRCGMMADPFQNEQEATAQWISEEDWEYRTTFDWQPDSALPNRVLRFEGLDTVSNITLNGEEIARHDNMFRMLEVDVSSRLKPGPNELLVHFSSPVRTGMKRRKAYFEANGIAHDTNWFDDRAFVRKAQYMSGWDWGPRLVSCGIWRPVQLLEFAARIVSFTVFQERLFDGRFRVRSETVLEGDAKLETSFDGTTYAGEFDVVVESPKLWWPNGEGNQPLYEASAKLSTGQTIQKRIGLRTIALVREPDSLGESFEFEVNGRRILAKGANWIPNDSFPSRITTADDHAQMKVCAELNMNMLRVWGGGLYESESFYDACDELGILVWQDFPYGCSYYPDGPAEQKIATEEAEEQIRRLRDRTCLAIWCGNNENDVMWQGKWGGPEQAPPRYFGDNIYAKALADVCQKLDPNRPYIRSSPIGAHKDDKAWGDEHYWDVWHGRGDWKFYAESNTRFSSEFGFASACGTDAWRLAAMEPAKLSPHDLPVVWHDKTNKAHETFVGYVDLHYPASATLEDWIYYSQLNQRDAFRFGIEHYRTNPYCRGTLIWQFNDCWPVQSWAVQDYARQLKIAGFEMRRLYAPILLSIRIGDQDVELWAANDRPERYAGSVVLDALKTTGDRLNSVTEAFDLAPGERKKLITLSTASLERIHTVFRAQIENEPETETWRTFGEPKEMVWPAPNLRREGETLHVSGLAYDMTVEVEGKPGRSALAGFSQNGLRTVCIANSSLKLALDGPNSKLQVRSLAGVQIV